MTADIKFNDREHALYRILCLVAEAGMPTPSHVDLAAAMQHARYRSSKADVANIVLKLKRAGMIEVAGSHGSNGDSRFYRIVGAEFQTTPRDVSAPTPVAPLAVSRLCLNSGAAYDAAVAAGLFGLDEVRPADWEAPRVHPHLYRADVMSYASCTAAMAAI